jgi:hypothetical protein
MNFRFVFALAIVLLIYGSANYFVARRLFQFINSRMELINGLLFTVFYIFLALTLVMGFLPLPFGINKLMRFISSYWMGIFMYLFLFFLIADLFIIPGRIFNIINTSILNNVRFYSGLAVIILTGITVCYGIINANQIKHVSYEIRLREASLNDMKIVLISDLHLGEVNSERNLERMVQAINELSPDIVCIAGDIFNDDFYAIRNPDRARALFRSINARYGVFACLGNHDGGRTLDQMMNFLEQSNIKLLNDEYVIIDGRVALFGRLDSSPIGGFGELKRQDISQTITSVGANMPVIVMEHSPSYIEEYGKEVDLILAGHTHRGQMFPGKLFTNRMFIVDYGHYRNDVNSPHVIVTSGVSTWLPPMRIGTNNEIVSILVR